MMQRQRQRDREDATTALMDSGYVNDLDRANNDAALSLKAKLLGTKRPLDDVMRESSKKSSSESIPEKINEDKNDEIKDDVRLWESGWKERYYQNKFHISLDDLEFRKKVIASYTEGLCWVLKYYYQGCADWKWFYPYHYAPFASDYEIIDLLTEFKLNFTTGVPFKPLEQLMGVLPPASRAHIPSPLHPLMMDEESEIIDFYPEKFEVDLNGKRHEWQGVALLPFIDETRLLTAMNSYYPKLNESQNTLNELGTDLLYVSSSNNLFENFCSLFGKNVKDPVILETFSASRYSISGMIKPDFYSCLPGSTYYSPLESMADLEGNKCISMIYINPSIKDSQGFEPKLLPGVRKPSKQLSYSEYISSRERKDRRS
jgi:5'-3' exoribonuclease 2